MHIGILYGGVSDESDVSKASAEQVSEVLAQNGHTVFCWYMNNRGEWQKTQCFVQESDPRSYSVNEFSVLLLNQRPDIVFPIMHGVVGEDGRIQALLEWLDIPYVGSGLLPSATCLNKWACKQLVGTIGVKTVPSQFLSNSTVDAGLWDADSILNRLGSKCVVKPNDSGSSIGVSLAGEDELHSAILLARKSSNSGVLIESFLESKDVEVPIIDDGDSKYVGTPCMMIFDGVLFDRSQKYDIPLVREHLPNSQFGQPLAEHVTQLALRIFEHLDLRSIARVDFLITTSGEVFFNEVNTIPFLTRESCVYDGIGHRFGWSYDELILKLIGSASPNAKYWRQAFKRT